MKAEMFEELLGRLREAGTILGGQKKCWRRMVISPSCVPENRFRSHMEFPGYIYEVNSPSGGDVECGIEPRPGEPFIRRLFSPAYHFLRHGK